MLTASPVVETHAHKGHVSAIAFSPDGRTLLTSGFDGLVKAWAVGTWKQTKEMAGHEKSVNSISFSPDGGTMDSA
jgi:WD40 repeat protein